MIQEDDKAVNVVSKEIYFQYLLQDCWAKRKGELWPLCVLNFS